MVTDYGIAMASFEKLSKHDQISLICGMDTSGSTERKFFFNRTKSQLSATYSRIISPMYDNGGMLLVKEQVSS